MILYEGHNLYTEVPQEFKDSISLNLPEDAATILWDSFMKFAAKSDEPELRSETLDAWMLIEPLVQKYL